LVANEDIRAYYVENNSVRDSICNLDEKEQKYAAVEIGNGKKPANTQKIRLSVSIWNVFN